MAGNEPWCVLETDLRWELGVGLKLRVVEMG